MDTLEEEARILNAADSHLRNAIRAYIQLGWTEEEFMERVEELYSEEA